MEEPDIMLLFQLIEGINNGYSILEKAYGDSDKEKFDLAKSAILDFQKKIKFLVEQ